jgi:hypothetical protein
LALWSVLSGLEVRAAVSGVGCAIDVLAIKAADALIHHRQQLIHGQAGYILRQHGIAPRREQRRQLEQRPPQEEIVEILARLARGGLPVEHDGALP